VDEKALFTAENICKSYADTQVLHDISLNINEGEVVGLVGENGAGKSTLLKIIMGVEHQTLGSMSMMAQEYAPKSPKQANAMGVGMVFQEQSLIANLTVGQNIFFGKEKDYKKFGLINWRKMYAEARKVLDSLQLLDIPVEKKLNELSFATRQMVEIAKVFNSVRGTSSGNSLILLDEPTSVLNDEEIKQLFKHIKTLRDEGNAIIFVSHRLDEVLEISDRIYILKDGKKAGEFKRSSANEELLYEKMVGRTSTGEYYQVHRQTEPRQTIAIEAKDLGLMGYFKEISFKLHEGEILGICGVIGSGKEDLCEVLSGEREATSGHVKVFDHTVSFKSPYQAFKAGILSIPKERREEGIIGILSVLDNISISNTKAYKKYGCISKKKQVEVSIYWIKHLGIKCKDYKEPALYLSGGNAQKVVFARLLASGCRIMILNHPTRGVDVGAKEEIYKLIRDVTKKGIAVILLGDTLDECIGLSNKVLVMKDGIATKTFEASASHKPEQLELIKYMM